jgi:uncharacterized membrane protein
MDQKFSVSSALNLGLELTKKHFLFVWGVILLTGIISGIVSSFYNAAIANDQYFLAFLLYIPVLAVMAFFGVNSVKIFLQLVDGKQPKFAELFDTKGNFVNYFLTSILFGLIVSVGFILLFVPGIILALIFGLSTIVVVDKKVGILKSFSISRGLTAGYRVDLFLFGLALLGINILGAIPFGLGLIFTIPFTTLSSYMAYKLIRDEKYDHVVKELKD